jgi:hypothetical protein
MADGAAFEMKVRPLLVKYCVPCHGSAKPKAGVNLASLSDQASVARNRKIWRRAVEAVGAGVMPPEGKAQPSAAERGVITAWTDGALKPPDCGQDRDPRRVTIRRLNRAEYNNTIRDLLGFDCHAADDFPSDDVGYGFDNIGDVLTLSPILLERYMSAAEKIASQAIVVDRTSRRPNKIWQAEALGKEASGLPYGDWARILPYTGELAVSYDCPGDGACSVRVRAFGQQAGPEPAKMALKLDGRTLKTIDVKAEEKAPALYEVKTDVRKGRHQIAAAFLNDFYNEKATDPKGRDRNLVIDYLEVRGPQPPRETALPESHRRIIFRTPTKETRNECARAVLTRFATKAWRRSAAAGEVGRLMKFVDLAAQNGESFEGGIQLAVKAILVSPEFIFRVELDPRPPRNGSKTSAADAMTAQPINEYELASRLSYFLWSSMPDDELFRLAEQGKLRADGNLEKQVWRMLRDPKARALVENFADQWLQVRNLKSVHPDKGRYPSFDARLRSAMLQETERFFEAVLREDRSILDFLDADFTFVNERLARHYGIPNVKGDQFRRVSLQGDRRGGLLTQASILTITSNPTRTSPVKRGKWILEQILGTPPPPAPPGVPDLKEDKNAVLSGTLRQRMEQHRANPSCASCHSRLDPLGFGLENFDAVGAWRDRDGKFPIDSSGKLPSGESFQGAKELKRILKRREREFSRCLAQKMLTYAIGRGLDGADDCAVDRIVDALAKNQYRLSRLVLEVVGSDPFQKRRGEGEKPR